MNDPVCGMKVDVKAPHQHKVGGTAYVFCSAHCLERFKTDPEAFLGKPAARSPSGPGQRSSRYTCPMHLEIIQDRPGTCPKCGMALELMTVSAEESPEPELTDVRRRIWISAPLTAPLIVIAMWEMFSGYPLHGPVWKWLQVA